MTDRSNRGNRRNAEGRGNSANRENASANRDRPNRGQDEKLHVFVGPSGNAVEGTQRWFRETGRDAGFRRAEDLAPTPPEETPVEEPVVEEPEAPVEEAPAPEAPAEEAR